MSFKDTFYRLTDEFSQEVESMVNANPTLADNSYVGGFRAFFTNKIAVHINYTNFNLIMRYLDQDKATKMNILDLGCGFGDKAFLLKRLFTESTVYGVETTTYDDPNQQKDPPRRAFDLFYPHFKAKFDLNLSLYDGLALDFPDNFFDVIVLYAVVEHIAPEKRPAFVKEISKKLKPGGRIIITRCPRKYSLTEIAATKMGLDHHPWRLSKSDLLGCFDEAKFQKLVLRSISNIPSNPYTIIRHFVFMLIPLDYALGWLHWPLASDYFLIEEKRAQPKV